MGRLRKLIDSYQPPQPSQGSDLFSGLLGAAGVALGFPYIGGLLSGLGGAAGTFGSLLSSAGNIGTVGGALNVARAGLSAAQTGSPGDAWLGLGLNKLERAATLEEERNLNLEGYNRDLARKKALEGAEYAQKMVLAKQQQGINKRYVSTYPGYRLGPLDVGKGYAEVKNLPEKKETVHELNKQTLTKAKPYLPSIMSTKLMVDGKPTENTFELTTTALNKLLLMDKIDEETYDLLLKKAMQRFGKFYY